MKTPKGNNILILQVPHSICRQSVLETKVHILQVIYGLLEWFYISFTQDYTHSVEDQIT